MECALADDLPSANWHLMVKDPVAPAAVSVSLDVMNDPPSVKLRLQMHSPQLEGV